MTERNGKDADSKNNSPTMIKQPLNVKVTSVKSFKNTLTPPKTSPIRMEGEIRPLPNKKFKQKSTKYLLPNKQIVVKTQADRERNFRTTSPFLMISEISCNLPKPRKTPKPVSSPSSPKSMKKEKMAV